MPRLVSVCWDEEGGGTRLHNRLICLRMARARSTDDRFGHEDIWLAAPIGIWYHAHNHVALLLIKLIGMLLQVLEVGQVFPDMRKEIDPRKGGLLIFVIGAKGNRQPTTFFYALFQSFEGEPKLLHESEHVPLDL